MIKILSCKCHAVCSDGRVLSLLSQHSEKGKRGVITVVGDQWKELKPTQTSSGYLQVGIHGKSIRVNRLVALNFIGNPLGYSESQHIDGNKLNNADSNLKWGTQKHNADDRRRHGNTCRGENSPQAKLTEQKVQQIRALRATGMSLLALARAFNVSKKLILLIGQNKAWRHV